jgi:hypothetical protein
VLAVAEAAVLGQVEHIDERPLDATATAPQAHGAHTRGVDEPAVLAALLSGQGQQLARAEVFNDAIVRFESGFGSA